MKHANTNEPKMFDLVQVFARPQTKFDFCLEFSPDQAWIGNNPYQFEGDGRFSGEIWFDEKVLLRGNIIIPTRFVCSRCGAPFSENLFIEVSETLTQAPTNEHFALTGDKVDLFEIVRQVVASNIPSQALCSPNCLGVCPKCGINRNEASCKCDEPKTGNNNPFAGLMGKFN